MNDAFFATNILCL